MNRNRNRLWVEKVRTMMRYKGLDEEKLANAAGLSLQTVKTLFSGNGNPRYSTICKVAKALNTEPGFIMDRSSHIWWDF